jgi:hypothetical protein
MEPELRDRIEERVIAGDAPNASAWAREAIAGVVELGGLPALQRALELVGRSDPVQAHPPRALQLRSRPLGMVEFEACPHPESQREKMPYHVRCGRCGGTVP